MGWTRDVDEKPNILGKHENLCWSCKNSTTGCSWSRDSVPVEGWDADEEPYHGDVTYKIRDCPLFEMSGVKADYSKNYISV